MSLSDCVLCKFHFVFYITEMCLYCIMSTLCTIYFRAHCITYNVHFFYSRLSVVYLLCVNVFLVHCSAEMSFNLV